MEESIPIYEIHLTKEEVLLARKVIAQKLNNEFSQDVFGLYDNFLIAIGDE